MNHADLGGFSVDEGIELATATTGMIAVNILPILSKSNLFYSNLSMTILALFLFVIHYLLLLVVIEQKRCSG